MKNPVLIPDGNHGMNLLVHKSIIIKMNVQEMYAHLVYSISYPFTCMHVEDIRSHAVVHRIKDIWPVLLVFGNGTDHVLCKRKLDAANVDDITFIKHEHGKKKRLASHRVYDPRPAGLAQTSETKISSLRDRLVETGKDIALLYLLLPPLPIMNTATSSLPLPPPVKRESILSELALQPQPVNYHSIAAAVMNFLSSLLSSL